MTSTFPSFPNSFHVSFPFPILILYVIYLFRYLHSIKLHINTDIYRAQTYTFRSMFYVYCYYISTLDIQYVPLYPSSLTFSLSSPHIFIYIYRVYVRMKFSADSYDGATDAKKRCGGDNEGDEDEDKEPEEPLDVSWPDLWYKKVTYVILFPIIIPLWLTLPDVRRPVITSPSSSSYFTSIYDH